MNDLDIRQKLEDSKKNSQKRSLLTLLLWMPICITVIVLSSVLKAPQLLSYPLTYIILVFNPFSMLMLWLIGKSLFVLINRPDPLHIEGKIEPYDGFKNKFWKFLYSMPTRTPWLRGYALVRYIKIYPKRIRSLNLNGDLQEQQLPTKPLVAQVRFLKDYDVMLLDPTCDLILNRDGDGLYGYANSKTADFISFFPVVSKKELVFTLIIASILAYPALYTLFLN